MLDTYKVDDYYSAVQVAEIKGISKQAVIDGCKRGQYPGAFKTNPDRLNTQGIWLIPKHEIDSPLMVQDVAVLSRRIDPHDLIKMMAATINPLREELVNVKQENADLRSKVQELQEQVIKYNDQRNDQAKVIFQRLDTVCDYIEETRTERNRKKGFFAKLFG